MAPRCEWAHVSVRPQLVGPGVAEDHPDFDEDDFIASQLQPGEWAITCGGIAVHGGKAQLRAWLVRALALIDAPPPVLVPIIECDRCGALDAAACPCVTYCPDDDSESHLRFLRRRYAEVLASRGVPVPELLPRCLCHPEP